MLRNRGRSERLDWAIHSIYVWAIPKKITRDICRYYCNGDTNHGQTDGPPSAIYPSAHVCKWHPKTLHYPDPLRPASPHSAHLHSLEIVYYAPPWPVFWFARLLKRSNQASEAREMAKQNPGLAQNTQTHKMSKIARKPTSIQFPQLQPGKRKVPIVAGMTCPDSTLGRCCSVRPTSLGRLTSHGKRPTFFRLLTICPKDALVKAGSRTCQDVAVPLWICSPIVYYTPRGTLIAAFASLVLSEPCGDYTAQLPLKVNMVAA